MVALPEAARRPLLQVSAGTSLRREVLVCALALSVLAAVLLGWYVRHGGFYWDDWENAANAAAAYEPGFLGPIRVRMLFYEPGIGLLIPLTQKLFGLRPELHLAFAAALTVSASACYFAVLRLLRLRAVHAAAVAALVLVFPWSDSNRLWATGGLNNAAICLFLAGLALALRELQSPSRRLRIASLALYGGSVLTYDIAGLAILASGALYFTAASRMRARERWRLDVIVVLPLVVLATVLSTKHKNGPVYALQHGWEIARQAVSLTGRALLPVAGVPAGAGVALAVAVLGLAGLVAWRPGTDPSLRRSLRRWLAVAGAAMAATAVAYAEFVPADPKYVPFADGLYNRVNLLAGFALAALVYALAVLAARLVCAPRVMRPAATALALLLVAAVGGAWAAQVGRDEHTWVRAAQVQSRVLGAVRHASPRPPLPGTVFYTFGAPLKMSRGIPVFAITWDLDAAAKLAFRDRSVRAAPVPPGARVRCGARGVRAPTPGVGTARALASYGRLVLVDVRSGRSFAIGDRAECLRRAAQLAKG